LSPQTRRSSSRWWGVSRTLAAAAIALPLCAAHAAQTEEADLKEEIILRCHNEMGEFGVEMVQHCIEAENAALKDVSSYPANAAAIVSRCKRYARDRGWAMVKVCVDQDIAAAAALDHYPAEHAAVIEQCRTEVEKQGPAKVKACVDQRLAAQPATKR
jgi:SepF-like predicted cell division protein (DUF552 family)